MDLMFDVYLNTEIDICIKNLVNHRHKIIFNIFTVPTIGTVKIMIE